MFPSPREDSWYIPHYKYYLMLIFNIEYQTASQQGKAIQPLSVFQSYLIETVDFYLYKLQISPIKPHLELFVFDPLLF